MGDPLKAQGAQPCKGDQTLGKVEAIRMEPYRGAPPTTKDGQCYSIVRVYRVFFASISLLSSRPPRNTYSFAAFGLAFVLGKE